MGQNCMKSNDKTSSSSLIQNPLFSDLEFRDRFFLLKFKHEQLKSEELQQSLQKWVNELTNQTISVAFHYVEQDKMNYNRAKLFVTKNIIRNIVALSFNTSLTGQNIKRLNQFMANKLFPFLKNKYPLNSNNQINKKLVSSLKEIDNFQSSQNDYILKSSVTFDINQHGMYNGNIMKLLNQLIGLPDKQTQKIDFQFGQIKLKKKTQSFTLDMKQKMTEKLTYYQLFYGFFSNIFESVYDYQTMNQDNEQMDFIQSKKISYRQQVQGYTSYQIGRKISANTQKFAQQAIQNLSLDIKSPAIIRILTKWAEQLWKKFEDQTYFIDWAQRFYYVDKRQGFALPRQKRKILQRVVLQQKKKIQEQIQKILEKNYNLQALILNQCKNRQIGYIPNLQFEEGYFATLSLKSLDAYLIKYLNILIHGLARASQAFHHQYTKISQRYLLTTFKIGDLIRCKCHSRQKQILHIYKCIQKVNDQRPQILKIIRLKNRLSSNTKDILINVRFYGQLNAQIQLAIDSQSNKYTQNCTNFNHFIYELERAKFGPISQLSSLWMNLNEQAPYFKKYIKDSKIRNKIQKNHLKICNKHIFTIQIDPFICSICHGFQIQNSNLILNQKCQKCEYKQCGLCRLKIMNQNELKNQIFHQQKLRNSSYQFIYKQNQKLIPKIKINQDNSILSEIITGNQYNLPNNGIIFNKYTRAKRLTCFKIFIDQFQKQIIVTIRNNQKPKIYQGSFQQFLKNHIIYQNSIVEEKYFKNINLEIIIKQCKLPKLFKKMQQKQKKLFNQRIQFKKLIIY